MNSDSDIPLFSKTVKPYPTHSLREYLAHQSIVNSENLEDPTSPVLEIEVDIGDGRKELLSINSSTNIDL